MEVHLQGRPDLGNETPLARPQGLMEVSERCSDGVQVLQSRRQALHQDRKGTRVLSTLGWESPNVLSVSFTSLAWFQKNTQYHLCGGAGTPQHKAGLEMSYSSQASCKPEQVMPGLRTFRHQDAAIHRGNSSSPPALAICGPTASPSRRWCAHETSWWLLLSMDLLTHFFCSNHEEELMKP